MVRRFQSFPINCFTKISPFICVTHPCDSFILESDRCTRTFTFRNYTQERRTNKVFMMLNEISERLHLLILTLIMMCVGKAKHAFHRQKKLFHF